MNLKISALEYAEGVQNGSISAEDFVACTLEQIEKVDEKIHAFLSVYDGAVDKARDIDKRIKSGETVGACCGMPISVKDNICITGEKTTCGSRMLEDYVSPYDATVISRLRDEDAVFVGKTNMDEFAMGLTTEFSAFGPSYNPWDTSLTPGGSSGGSAASVSAFECSASLGSDTGGSVRNPASFCSVVGYKPTYGLISRYGLVSYANSIEQIGPLSRTVKDTAFLLDVIAGSDPLDNTTVDSTGGYLSGIESGIEGKKIGLVSEMTGEGIDSAVASATSSAVSKLEGLGATCEEVSLDMVKYSVASYYTITATEAGSNLARYDNLRYGYDFGVEGYEFNSYIERARSKFGAEVTRRMILGGFVPSAGHAGRYFLKALKVKSKLSREMGQAFEKFDLLLSPTVPVLPFGIGDKIDDPVSLFLVDINTVTANLTGRPAVSVPFAVSGGRPIGMQLMADSMRDAELLQAAFALEQTVRLPEVPI
ncbi:MAG: Asp-tRNA(Asn)/Glu-tRNA(Gln) amidotransferase subunit GatA [Nitrosopumilus sp. B06]|nr:MAG: Asp-tRNA(Asn)/Glu-tRNA(Gln) amidotransferase subunit GatA [Nitrosopumilus sp. B06]